MTDITQNGSVDFLFFYFIVKDKFITVNINLQSAWATENHTEATMYTSS